MKEPVRREICSGMTHRGMIDEYFIENRTRLLDLAAFLDRLDRAESDQKSDFRMEAFKAALAILGDEAPSRVKKIQMVFSDPTAGPREGLDQKSARGAFDPAQREVR